MYICVNCHSELFDLQMPRFYKRKREGYDFERLKRAVEDVRTKGFSVYKASRIHLVPRTTIHDYLKEEIITEHKRGHKPVFNEHQEKNLEEHILHCNQLFNAITPDVIRKIAFNFAKAYNITNNFDRRSKMAGRDWYYAFLKRHPNIVPVPAKKVGECVEGGNPFNEAEVLRFSDNRIVQEIIHHVDDVECQTRVVRRKKRKLNNKLASTYRSNPVSHGEKDM